MSNIPDDFTVFEYEMLFDVRYSKKVPTLLSAYCQAIDLPLRQLPDEPGMYRALLPPAGKQPEDFAHALNALASFVHFHKSAGRLVPMILVGGYKSALILYKK